MLVYATFPTEAEARSIGTELVAMRLAACVNVLSGVHAIYRWQGRATADAEAVAIVKTRADLAERVTAVVRVLHTYTNPAVVVLSLAGGSPHFLDWIVAETCETL